MIPVTEKDNSRAALMIIPRSKRIFACVLLLLALSSSCMPGLDPAVEPQASLASWKFAVISDTQGNNRDKTGTSCINDAVVRAIADDIVRENPDFVLVAGDLVNGWFRNKGVDYAAQYAGWKAAIGPVYRAGIRVYPVRGNHDSGPERLALPPLPTHLEPQPDTPVVLKKAFRDAFPEAYIPKNGPAGEEGLTFSFTHKNAFVVGLDQFTNGQHRVNQEWLDLQLEGSRGLHVFVFGHEPAFEANHRDNLSFYPRDRDLFWDSIGNAGARVYFCGHDHFYNHALVLDNTGREIRQIIAGTGGGFLRRWSGTYREGKRMKVQYHNNDHHGYILAAVEGSKVTISWKALIKPETPAADAWQVLDSFTYSIPADRQVESMLP
mgnify:CR=1 FL=1